MLDQIFLALGPLSSAIIGIIFFVIILFFATNPNLLLDWYKSPSKEADEEN
jgi:hypothetical protein